MKFSLVFLISNLFKVIGYFFYENTFCVPFLFLQLSEGPFYNDFGDNTAHFFINCIVKLLMLLISY